MDASRPITRRSFLRRSFAFSAAVALAGCDGFDHRTTLSSDPVDPGGSNFLMLGDWGISTTSANQSNVAQAMQTYAGKHQFDTDALFMLGDNFYGNMPDGVSSPRWQTQFEQMYPASVFPGPAYAVLGNHDYQNAPSSKVDVELAYALLSTSRWTMPSRYYRFVDPGPNQLVTFIALDSNMPSERAQPYPPPDASYYTPSDSDRLTQLAWLTAQLQQPLTTPFLVVMGHHPLYSNGLHGDNHTLIRDWSPLLAQSKAHLYIAGHDHDLQHIEIAGHPTSFFLSGGGGGELHTVDSDHGPFSQQAHGFSHIQGHADLMTMRHLDIHGNLLHKFTKTPDGIVNILK